VAHAEEIIFLVDEQEEIFHQKNILVTEKFLEIRDCFFIFTIL